MTHCGKRHIPLPTGPYTVGCTDIMTADAKFGVFVRLYYPSIESKILDHHLQWPLWLPDKNYIKGYVNGAGSCHCLYKVFRVCIGKLYIPAIWQAPIRPSKKEKYPIVIFSHGLYGWRTSYSGICLELASHGFVVAALEHRDYSASASFYQKKARMSAYGPSPGSNLGDLDDILSTPQYGFDDVLDANWEPTPRQQEIGPFSYSKEWMFYKPVTEETELSFRNQQLRHRVNECIETFDMLENLNRGKLVLNILDTNFNSIQFKDQLNIKKAFMIGHSFGGATTILCLASEVRFRAGILLDPWMFPFQEDSSMFSMITQPLISLNVESFQTQNSLRTMQKLQESTCDSEFFSMVKAQHRDLSDVPFINRVSFSISEKLSLKIEKFSALDLAIDFILTFLGKQLGIEFLNKNPKVELLKMNYLKKQEFP